jgi:exodeoxyribonuclease V alpha subunit
MPAIVAEPGGGAVLDGVLERVTFANPETGCTIARIAPERGGAGLVTAAQSPILPM